MLETKATIEKYDENGEKSGWTYIFIDAEQAQLLLADEKKSYRVRGKIDSCPILQIALWPMGEGSFILPLNDTIRKKVGKTKGQTVLLKIEYDDEPLKPDDDFIGCLEDAPEAKAHFETLSPSHRKYFSQWIGSAKTEATKVKRITMALEALALQMGYPEMLRFQKERKAKLG